MNIAEILRDCPKETKLYSPIFGEVTLVSVVSHNPRHSITVSTSNKILHTFTKDGLFIDYYNGECLLFPSKDNRDWDTFKAPKNKCDFKPFDKVLGRDFNDSVWRCDIFSHITKYADDNIYICIGDMWKQCVPYEGNQDLVGTTKKPK